MLTNILKITFAALRTINKGMPRKTMIKRLNRFVCMLWTNKLPEASLLLLLLVVVVVFTTKITK